MCICLASVVWLLNIFYVFKLIILIRNVVNVFAVDGLTTNIVFDPNESIVGQ